MAGLLTMMVSGNNLSAAVGTIIGARTVRRRTGLLIGLAGFSIGLVTEGRFLLSASGSLMPRSDYYVFLAFLVSFVIFTIATYFRTPLSLTMALVGTAAGISLRLSFPVPYSFLFLLILVWILAPVLSIAGSFALSRLIQARESKNAWETAATSKVLLIAASFFTAFTLGANTLGLILTLAGASTWVYVSMLIGIAVGSIFLGGGTIKRIGEELYSMRYSSALVSLLVSSISVEVSTIFGVPLSNTQTLTSSVVGTGLSYRYKTIYLRPYLVIIGMWVVSPIAGFILGFLI